MSDASETIKGYRTVIKKDLDKLEKKVLEQDKKLDKILELLRD